MSLDDVGNGHGNRLILIGCGWLEVERVLVDRPELLELRLDFWRPNDSNPQLEGAVVLPNGLLHVGKAHLF